MTQARDSKPMKGRENRKAQAAQGDSGGSPSVLTHLAEVGLDEGLLGA